MDTVESGYLGFLNSIYSGAALAAALTHWASVILHVSFIVARDYYKTTWTGIKRTTLLPWLNNSCDTRVTCT